MPITLTGSTFGVLSNSNSLIAEDASGPINVTITSLVQPLVVQPVVVPPVVVPTVVVVSR